MDPIKLSFPPGIVKIDSPYASIGRFIDSQWVRFHGGFAQKIGGWTKWTATQLLGVPRSMKRWKDNSKQAHLIVGTNRRLYAISGDSQTVKDITPARLSGIALPNNPFNTVSFSPTIIVEYVAHGLSIGDFVEFGGTISGAFIPSGAYEVTSVIDATYFTIMSATAPGVTGASGGAAVTISILIAEGSIDAKVQKGWGISRWGKGSWGTPRNLTTYKIPPRIWTIDKYGQDMVAMPIGGRLYYWPAGSTNRATAVNNSPATGNGVCVSEDRHVIVWGADGDPMLLKWPHQTDITNWTPSTTTTAGSRKLQFGNEIVAVAAFGGLANLVWSDTHIYVMQYTGSKFIFDGKMLANYSGLISPQGYVIVEGVAYWMGQNGFSMFSGSLSAIPNEDDIRQHVYAELNRDQAYKIICFFNPEFDEVWWLYPAGDSNENNRYVFFNLKMSVWGYGVMGRSAVCNDFSGSQKPIMASRFGRIFAHETGLDGDGKAINCYLKSGLFDIASGGSSLDIDGFIPDFKEQKQAVIINLDGFEYPRRETPIESYEILIPPGASLCDARMHSRQLSITVASREHGGYFRMGTPLLLPLPGSAKR